MSDQMRVVTVGLPVVVPAWAAFVFVDHIGCVYASEDRPTPRGDGLGWTCAGGRNIMIAEALFWFVDLPGSIDTAAPWSGWRGTLWDIGSGEVR